MLAFDDERRSADDYSSNYSMSRYSSSLSRDGGDSFRNIFVAHQGVSSRGARPRCKGGAGGGDRLDRHVSGVGGDRPGGDAGARLGGAGGIRQGGEGGGRHAYPGACRAFDRWLQP